MKFDIIELLIAFLVVMSGVYLRYLGKTKNVVWFLGSLKRKQKIIISNGRNGKCPHCGHVLNGRISDAPKNTGDDN